MKVLNTEKIPVKMWLEDVEDNAMEQVKNLALSLAKAEVNLEREISSYLKTIKEEILQKNFIE